MNDHDRPTPPNQKRHVSFVLALTILLGCGLRLFQLGAESIWYDEGVSIYLARLSIPSLIAHTAGDIHPPLYYVLLNVWIRLAGPSHFAAAFLSLFFGVLLIPTSFVVARRLFGREAGLFTAFLVAISPYNLWYSQEVRMYTVGAWLGLATFYCLLRFLSDGGRRTWPLVAYAVCAALGLYTLYYFAFLLLFENLAVAALWLAGRFGRQRTILSVDAGRWLAAQAAVAVLYLPWLPTALRQATEPPVPPWRSFTSLGGLLSESWAALSLGQSVEVRTIWPLLLLTALLFALGLAPEAPGEHDRRRLGWWQRLLAAGYSLVPVLIIYLASLLTPLYHVRYVFLYASGFYLILGRGLTLLRRLSPALAALVLAVLSLASLRSAQAYFFDPAYAPDDHRGAVRYLAERIRPGDALLINAGYVYPTFLYYYQGDIAWRGRLVDYVGQPQPAGNGLVVLQTGSIGGSASLGWGSPVSDFYATTEEETAAALAEVARRHERLWVLRIYDTVTDPRGFIRRYLETNFLPLDDAGFAGTSSMRVQGYRTYHQPRTAVPDSTATPLGDLGHRMNLLAAASPAVLYPNEVAYLTTYWRAVQPAGEDLRAFVGLVDAAGREWAHWDDVPAGRLYPTSRWAVGEVVRQVWRLDVPPGVPPGDYGLEVGLYGAASGVRLSAFDAGGRATGTALRLGRVQVERARSAVDVKTLPMKERVNADVGGEVRLLGYSVASRLVQPGLPLDLSVFWQGVRTVAGSRVVFVQVQDMGGKLWAAWEGPAPDWQAGDVLRGEYRLLLPADTPDGEMRVVIGVYRADDKQRLPVKRGLASVMGRHQDSVLLTTVRVAGREHSFAVPAMKQAVGARLGEGAVLLGYDLSGSQQSVVERGSRLALTLYWQGKAPMSTSYTVFVQLLGEGNRLAGQDDAIPGDGQIPTTSWLTGEVIADRHDLIVRPDAPPGRYRLAVGLYDAATWARLPVVLNGARQPDDMVILQEMDVR